MYCHLKASLGCLIYSLKGHLYKFYRANIIRYYSFYNGKNPVFSSYIEIWPSSNGVDLHAKQPWGNDMVVIA